MHLHLQLILYIYTHIYRFFLRVDDVIVKIKETRLFHQFSSSPPDSDQVRIHVEVTWKEVKLPLDLTTTAISTSMSGSSGSTSSGSTTSTNGGVSGSKQYMHNASISMLPSLLHDPQKLADIATVVNEDNSVYPYYTIIYSNHTV